MRNGARLVTGLAIALAATAAPAQQPAEPASAGRAAGLAAWEEIHAVVSHPRCASCHVEDDRPRWSGAHYGKTRPHGFNVRRGLDGSGFGNPGLRCTACHFESNSSILHGPPGAPLWHLAPAAMAWWEKDAAAICAQLKDPERNGGRSLEEIALHMRDDPLVRWGWQPGPGREPAPGSPEAAHDAVLRWEAAGAPCPGE